MDGTPEQRIINGRYRLVRSLGRGGMGSVHLAADLAQEERPVALKQIHASLANAEMVATFKGEFEAHARLRHPNIVEIFDFGTDQSTGQPFLTLEYVQGDGLATAVRGRQVPEVLDLLVQVCRGLAYIHSRGLIHNDLKPQNILVTHALPPICKVSDFGLVSGRSVQDEARTGPRGTLQYLAPELISGGTPDILSDIYSLGVLFYLVLAGRLPYDGEPAQVLELASAGNPAPPREFNPDLPAPLQALILRMISKNRADRPAGATSVIEALGEATGQPLDLETSATMASYVRTASFVGRERELDRLVKLVEAIGGAESARATARRVIVSGESGVGKSRLLRRLRYEAQVRGVDFVLGGCFEGSGTAFHPFLQALKQTAAPRPGQKFEEMLHGERSGLPGEADAPTEREAENSHRRAIDSAVETLHEYASTRPLVVCIEDLQWADSASLSLLEHLARNTPDGGPLLLIVSYRSEEIGSAPLATALPRLKQAADWLQLELSRFDRDQVGEMIGGMFGIESLPDDLLDRLAEETEGNPFYVQMALESLIETTTLQDTPGHGWLEDIDALSRIPFPRSVGDAIAKRVSRLPATETRLLEAIAVAGRPVTHDFLERVLGEDDAFGKERGLLEAAMDGLLRRRIVASEVDVSGVITTRIDHVKIREHVHDAMNWQRRSEMHGRIGGLLEQDTSAGVEELADHYLQSSDTAKALDYAERAGRRALSLFASDQAVRYLERTLELVAPSDARHRLRILQSLGEAYIQARDPRHAAETFEKLSNAARAAGAMDVAWRATSRLVESLWRSGQHDEARRLADKVIPVLRSLGERHTLASCVTTLANLAASHGRFDEARDLLKEALAIRREIGDEAGSASCLNNLGLIDAVGTPTEEGLEMFQEALAIRRRLGNHQQEAEVLGNLGIWHRKNGDIEEAIRRIEEAAELDRKYRDRWHLAQTQVNLGALYLAQGRMDRARAAARLAVASARATGDAALECEGLDFLGITERHLGHMAGARAAHERALGLARKIGSSGQEAYAQTSLALDLLLDPSGQETDPKQVKECLRKASKLCAGIESQRLQGRLHEALALSLMEEGQPAAALEEARQALGLARDGKLREGEAIAGLLVAECLAATIGDDESSGTVLAEAIETTRAATVTAAESGYTEPRWRGHLLLSRLEARQGRRAAERVELGHAASVLQETAATIGDEQVRLAYLAEPDRANVLRRAAAMVPATARTGVDGGDGNALLAVYEITDIINSLSDLDTMLDRLLDVGLGIVRAERGLIVLLDEKTGEQHVRAARDLEEETMRDALAYSHSIVRETAKGRVIIALDAGHDERFRDYHSVSLYAIKSLMCVPMKIRDTIIGTVYVDSRTQGIPFSEQDLRFLEAFANLAASAITQSKLQQKLASENVYLQKEATERHHFHNIVGKSVKMQAIYELVEKVSTSTLPVLIQGESGTGKELVARALHFSGPRRHRRFVVENVAAIPETLLESEMFGHVRGAFTGADKDRVGQFELADGGTLFLDEIGDMPLSMQSKVLRALQDGEIRQVGGKTSRKVDVRVVSATNKDIDKMMREGHFREDLYYRLNVIRVTMPALRDRKEDLPLLVNHFLKKMGHETGHPARKVEVGALQLLLRYSWPGNVRELENEIQRLAVLSSGEVITARDIMESGELYERITQLDDKETIAPLEELERRQIEKALVEAAGNRAKAAELLGISRATIFRKLRKYGISQ